MSEEITSTDKITLTRAKHGSLPPVGKKVLAETRDGGIYIAARFEVPGKKNEYFWGLVWKNEKGKEGFIGKLIVDVMHWYE